MVLAIFCDILSAMGPHSRLFYLEITYNAWVADNFNTVNIFLYQL